MQSDHRIRKSPLSREIPFTTIINAVIDDNRLSLKALGLMTYFLRLPIDWDIRVSHIIKTRIEGRTAVRKAIIELIKAGYVQRVSIRGENGRHQATEYHVDWEGKFEPPQEKQKMPAPIIKKKVPQAGFLKAGNLKAGNRPTTKEREIQTKENYKPAEAASAPPVVVSSDREKSYGALDRLQIDESLKKKITREHKPEIIETAVQRCLDWKGRECDEAAILTILKKGDKWNDPKSSNVNANKNIEFLRTLDVWDCRNVGGYSISVGKEYIEFNAGQICNQFLANDAQFTVKVKSFLEKIGAIKPPHPYPKPQPIIEKSTPTVDIPSGRFGYVHENRAYKDNLIHLNNISIGDTTIRITKDCFEFRRTAQPVKQISIFSEQFRSLVEHEFDRLRKSDNEGHLKAAESTILEKSTIPTDP